MDGAQITTIVFDQDGTLYDTPAMGDAVLEAAYGFVAARRSVSPGEARCLIDEARIRVRERLGVTPTLSLAIREMGLSLRDLHDHFARTVDPARHLLRDDRLVSLFMVLKERYHLVLYTNNNRPLTEGILAVLGLSDAFGRIFTIEDSWRPKPDRQTLETIFRECGVVPAECLFIGDREDIDVTLPVSMGARGVVVKTVDELLRVGQTLLEEGCHG